METPQLTGQDLIALGYPQTRIIRTALYLMETYFSDVPQEEQLQVLAQMLASPETYEEHPTLAPLAEKLLAPIREGIIPLRAERLPYATYGQEGIEAGAIRQMQTAMRLPVVVAGALM